MLNRIEELEKQLKQISDEIREIKKQENKMDQLKELEPGDKFMLCGKEFIVLDYNQFIPGIEVICNELWFENVRFGDTNEYAKSNVKELCNSIVTLIEKEIGKENLMEHCVDFRSVDGKTDYTSITCKVSPITFERARKYFPLLVNENLGDWWWMATPWNSKGIGHENALATVSPSGSIYFNSCVNFSGIRPFCVLKPTTLVYKCE